MHGYNEENSGNPLHPCSFRGSEVSRIYIYTRDKTKVRAPRVGLSRDLEAFWVSTIVENLIIYQFRKSFSISIDRFDNASMHVII